MSIARCAVTRRTILSIERSSTHEVRRCRRREGHGVGSEQGRSEEHSSELQSLMRISYAVFCIKNHILIKTHMIEYIFDILHLLVLRSLHTDYNIYIFIT